MAKQFFTLKSFQGGINSKDHPRDMHEMQSQDMQGLTTKDSGEAKSPGGYNTSAIFSSDAHATIQTTTGYGLFAFESDNKMDGDISNAKMIAFPFIDNSISADEAVLKIDQLSPEADDYHALEPDTNLDDGSAAITKPDLVYYYKNGALRVADANFHANAVPHKFIFNKRLQMLCSEANNKHWMWLSTELTPPTTFTGSAGNVDGTTTAKASTEVPGGTGVVGMPTSDRINIEHLVDTSVTTDLAGGTYEFAVSWVYDSGQESLLTEMGGTALAAIANTNGIMLRVYFKSRANSEVDERDFGAHIIGSRIYMRRVESVGDSWHLAIDVDFARGSRNSMLESFRGAGVGTGNTHSLTSYGHSSGDVVYYYTDCQEARGGSYTTYYLVTRMNPMTYESINGYRADSDAVSLSKSHGWKDATVLGTRSFLANISYIDEFGTSKAMGDRILYSMPNKFDIFPNKNFLDIGADDGESFTAIEGFAGMLFAFKNTNMYIVNVQSGSPAGWGIAGKYDFMGIKFPSAYTKTEFGIAWANEIGCYLSNGQGVQKLTNSIDDTTWNTFIHNTYPALVSYDPIEKNIIVQGNSVSSDDLYVFNMGTKSWTRQINNLVAAAQSNTNTSFHDGSLITASWNTSDNKVYIWKWDTTAASQAFVLHTKEFDLGQPQLKKKIYSVIITLNNNGANITSWKAYVGVDGATPSAQTGFSDNVTISSSGNWIVQTETLTTPLIGESFSFKFSGTGNVRIGDISVEYRPLRKRAD